MTMKQLASRVSYRPLSIIKENKSTILSARNSVKVKSNKSNLYSLGGGALPHLPQGVRPSAVSSQARSKQDKEYRLETFTRSNQDTCLTHKPAVVEGDWVQAGDFLTDCANSVGGELALGQNIFIAYMPWEGYNFEDAILISERLVIDDLFTSVHIERYEIENLQKNKQFQHAPAPISKKVAEKNQNLSFSKNNRETKKTRLDSKTLNSSKTRGTPPTTNLKLYEKITRDIPDASLKEISNLDSFGIVKVGSFIEEGDILVGKVTPINKKDFTPYQKLLYTILDKQIRPYRDSSLRAPKGIKAKVIDIKIFVKPSTISYSPYFRQNMLLSKQNNNKRMGNARLDKKNLKLAVSKEDDDFLRENKVPKTKKQTMTVGKAHLSQEVRPSAVSSLLTAQRAVSEQGSLTHQKNFKNRRLRNFNKENKIQALLKPFSFSNKIRSLLLKVETSPKGLGLWPSSSNFSDLRKKVTKTNHFIKDLSRSNVLFDLSRSGTSLQNSNSTPSFRRKLEEYFKKNQKKTLLHQALSEKGPKGLGLWPSSSNLFNLEKYTYLMSEKSNLPRSIIEKGTLSKITIPAQSKKLATLKSIVTLNGEFQKNSRFASKQRKLKQRKLYDSQSINDIETIHIYLAEKRKVQIGDKMSGRHGNKGIISQILPIQDMPFLPDGTTIDMVLNPLGVPSRMNVGQIYECLLGLAGKYLGENYKIFAFDEIYGAEASRSFVFNKLYEASRKTGFKWLFNMQSPGKIRIFDGRSGDPFHQPVTVGLSYMLRLVHMVDDKIHMRSTGPYSLVTQQPLRGRSKQGGQRLGEMEVWALEGYGAAFTLLEMLTVKSDDLTGRMTLWSNLILNKDLTIGTPEAFKVLICELQALCLDIGLFRYNTNNDFGGTTLPHFNSQGSALTEDLNSKVASFQNESKSFQTKPSLETRQKKSLQEMTSLMNFP